MGIAPLMRASSVGRMAWYLPEKCQGDPNKPQRYLVPTVFQGAPRRDAIPRLEVHFSEQGEAVTSCSNTRLTSIVDITRQGAVEMNPPSESKLCFRATFQQTMMPECRRFLSGSGPCLTSLMIKFPFPG
jgi:hypothetical protein